MLTVNHVEYTNAYKLRVSLSNGVEGMFDEHYLKQVKVDESGMGVYWPDEQDSSPDTLKAELIQSH